VRRRREGLTLVEASVVIALVGIALAIFVPAFVRELRISRTAEAAARLSELHRRAALYFAATHVPEAEEGGDALAPVGPQCLPEPAGPTPRRPSADGEEVAFEEAPSGATWAALGFAPLGPLRYAYTFEPTTAGCGLRAPEGTYLLTLRAEGDLDEDGERSVFERRATATSEGDLVPFGFLYVRDRAE
jgi:type II secretory pathway pseudopilin PulG